jgi:hypothetical protein
MAERRMTKADLARELDVSKTAITDLLTHGKPSTLVEDVERVLDLSEPSPSSVSAIHINTGPGREPMDPTDRNIVVMLRLLLELSPENQALLIERAETLLDVQRRSAEAKHPSHLGDSVPMGTPLVEKIEEEAEEAMRLQKKQREQRQAKKSDRTK